MRKDQILPQQKILGRPFCPLCHSQMWLAWIEPEKTGHDRRVFECPACPNFVEIVVKYRASMKSLILEPASSHYGGQSSDDDYVVLDAGEVIGRILHHPLAPTAHRWFWTITTLEQPPSTENRGYSATREEAMADFKAQLTVSNY